MSDEPPIPAPDPALMEASMEAFRNGETRTANEILTEIREQNKEKPVELSQDALLAILRRMSQAFKLVENTITGDFVGTIYIVYGKTNCDELPVTRKFDDESEAAAFVNECRAAQAGDPDHKHFIQIFYGQRWLIQKGQHWHLWTGKKAIPIEGGDILPFVDSSGTLTDEANAAPSERYPDNGEVEIVPDVSDTRVVGEESEED